jgi:eukaryotic-like serine/threonine-protein kinase
MFRRRTVTEQAVGPPRRPLIWPWLLLLLLLVAGGIAAAYLLTRDDESSAATVTRVPDVVGLSTGVALQQLAQRGYPAIIQGRATTGGERLGTVLAQNPRAGTELDSGQQVTIFVARGPSTVDVPNVVGLSAAQALLRLQAAKLKGQTKRIASTEPKDRVVRQAPAGGSQAKRSSTVVLTVSRGAQQVTVPSVVGLTEASATATLSRLGFRLSVSRVAGEQAKGTVISQEPQAKSRAPRGSIVGINVSTGPTATDPPPATGTVVPNVVGLSQRVALARLERARLKVDSFPVASSRPRGTVLSQLPAAGTRVVPRSRVRLKVSLGPGPRPQRVVPEVTGETEQAARRTLILAGFTVQTVNRAVSDPSEAGIVLEQKPASGQRAQVGSQILIHVGLLPTITE